LTANMKNAKNTRDFLTGSHVGYSKYPPFLLWYMQGDDDVPSKWLLRILTFPLFLLGKKKTTSMHSQLLEVPNQEFIPRVGEKPQEMTR